jgi:hypothetical protein
VRKRDPEGGRNAEEGSDRERGPTPRAGGTLRFADQGPEVGPVDRGSRFTSVSGRSVTARGHGPATSRVRLRIGRSP